MLPILTAANTSMRNAYGPLSPLHVTASSYRGFTPVTQTMLLNKLTGATTNYPLVPVKNAANISYMSYYLLGSYYPLPLAPSLSVLAALPSLPPALHLLTTHVFSQLALSALFLYSSKQPLYPLPSTPTHVFPLTR